MVTAFMDSNLIQNGFLWLHTKNAMWSAIFFRSGEAKSLQKRMRNVDVKINKKFHFTRCCCPYTVCITSKRTYVLTMHGKRWGNNYFPTPLWKHGNNFTTRFTVIMCLKTEKVVSSFKLAPTSENLSQTCVLTSFRLKMKLIYLFSSLPAVAAMHIFCLPLLLSCQMPLNVHYFSL